MTNLIVDSAHLIDLLRGGVDFRQLLVEPLRAGRLYSSGVIRAEVLRGVKLPTAHDKFQAFFDIIPEVPCDAKLWRAVSKLGWELGRKGKWPPVTDIIIAASALRVGAVLVSPDAHFADIPDLRVVTEIPKKNSDFHSSVQTTQLRPS